MARIDLNNGAIVNITAAAAEGTATPFLLDDPYATNPVGIYQPNGVVLTPDESMLLVSDAMNAIRCVRLEPTGALGPVITVAGNGSAGNANASPDTTTMTTFSSSFMAEASTAMFSGTQGMAWWQVTKTSWTFLVADCDNNAIRAVTLENDLFDPFPPSTLYYSSSATVKAASDAPLTNLYSHPYTGTVYAVLGSTKIVAMSSTSSSITFASNSSSNVIAGSNIQGYANGTGTLARFSSISCMAGDDNNYLYAIDSSALRRVNLTDRNVTTISGKNFANAQAMVVADPVQESSWTDTTASMSCKLYVAAYSLLYVVNLCTGSELVAITTHLQLQFNVTAMFLSTSSTESTPTSSSASSHVAEVVSLFIASATTVSCFDISLSTDTIQRMRVVAGSTSGSTSGDGLLREGFGVKANIPSRITDIVLTGDAHGWPCLYVKTVTSGYAPQILEIRLYDQYVRTLSISSTTSLSAEHSGDGMASYCNAASGEFGLIMSGAAEMGSTTGMGLLFIALGKSKNCSRFPQTRTITVTHTLTATRTDSAVTHTTTLPSVSMSKTSKITASMNSWSETQLQSATYVSTTTPTLSWSKNSTSSSPTVELASTDDENPLSGATIGVISSAAIFSLLSGGGAASSISVVMLSFLQCSNHPPVSVATYFVSVFFDLGSAATAIGNVGLCYAVYFLQMTIVAVVSRWKKAHPTVSAPAAKEGPEFSQQIDEKPLPPADSHVVTLPAQLIELMAQLRCPSIGVKVASLLLPGAALGATVGLTSHASSAGDVGVCIVACLLVMSIIGAQVAALRLVVLPHAIFAPYRHYVVGTMFEKRFLFPEARWEPMPLNQAFSPLMSTMREGFPMLLLVELLLACFIGVVSGAFIGGACDSSLLAIAATLYLLYGIVLAVLRPYRLPMDRACAPVVNVLLGIFCALQYADTRNATSSAGEALQLAVSLLQVMRSLCSLFIVNVREGDLRCGDPIDALHGGDETNHSKQIVVVMLAEDEPMPLLEDAEMMPIAFEPHEEVEQRFTPVADQTMVPHEPDDNMVEEAQEEDLMLLNLGDLHEGNFWDERGRAVEGSVEHAMMRGHNDLLRLFSEVTTEQE